MAAHTNMTNSDYSKIRHILAGLDRRIDLLGESATELKALLRQIELDDESQKSKEKK
jgi:hypothetical protein